MLPKALLHRPIKLIIIDSITAVFRGEYTPSEAPRRSRDLRDVAFCLHKMSVEHDLWVVCVNQAITNYKNMLHTIDIAINFGFSLTGNIINVRYRWKKTSTVFGIIMGQFGDH